MELQGPSPPSVLSLASPLGTLCSVQWLVESIYKELSWNFDGDCIESVDCFWQDGHFYYINLLRSFLISFFRDLKFLSYRSFLAWVDSHQGSFPLPWASSLHRTKGLSSHWFPTRPSTATCEAVAWILTYLLSVYFWLLWRVSFINSSEKHLVKSMNAGGPAPEVLLSLLFLLRKRVGRASAG